MLSQAFIIASKDRTLLLREKNFMLAAGIFIAMSIASAYIGWSSQHTITGIYQAAAETLISTGKPVPIPPFSTNNLLIMKNMIIYVTLIGALLSIVLGHIVAVSDRKAATSRVLFTRITPKVFLTGKTLAAASVLAFALIASSLTSIISLSVLHILTIQAFTSVAVFYIGSYIYLMGYIFLGMFFSLTARNSAQAVLIPILVWTVITFALPQMSLALYPTGALNPVLPQTEILNSPVLSMLHNMVYPFSVSEHFKEFSSITLGLNNNQILSNVTPFTRAGNMTVIILWAAVTFLMSAFAVRKYQPENGDSYE